MKLRGLTAVSILGICPLIAPHDASAGGLFLPGSGAISTSRAGAAVASSDDGEAISINPAGMAKVQGTVVTVSAAALSYSMEFTRSGTYDPIAAEDFAYEGTAYPTVQNSSKPPIGIGSYQPVPVIAIVSDLGGRVKGLHVGAGLYAPNAYPFRDMRKINGVEYQFNGDFAAPPPPSRYDILEQEAAVILPSVAASYRITPQLDVGARLSWGIANLKSTVALWGNPGNLEEYVKADAELTAEAKDNFVPGWGLGLTYRPTPQIELGANYNSALVVQATGTATSIQGPAVTLNGIPISIGPTAAGTARCAEGGTFDAQSACVGFQLPMSATVGGRYKFLDSTGAQKGDIELDVGWEHWGKRCEVDNVGLYVDPSCTSPGQYRVVVDAAAYVDMNADGMLTEDDIALTLKDNFVEHRLKDTFSFRLGGSYNIPLGATADGKAVIVRGGVGYDTRAAEEGWLRADIDGAARLTTTLGAAYKLRRLEIDAGFGFIYEGTNTNPGTCNPTATSIGCTGDGATENPIEDRQGPDPINPVITPANQFENPVNQGTFKSHYLLFMLGVSTWF
ncbi:MAG TPA: outer membrane protein transport protein [Kofleriaceae bacterium]|nr:outer membrane protein transport protein [Kofleriaceae bacterium]